MTKQTPRGAATAKRKRVRHPVQPLVKSKDGVIRCRANKIVRFLLDAGTFDMNQLAIMDFPREDREQFAQLIGYSFCGLQELDYVSDATIELVRKTRGDR